MGARIEIGDAGQYAGVASQILQAAWKPPCLHYSSDYLAWQFNFPGEPTPRAAVAFLDDRPVGCIAVTGRRFICGETRTSGYVLSFVAVDPSASGRGIAARMYADLLDALPADVPIFAFAEPDSIGERILISSFQRAAFRHRPFRPAQAAGFIQRPGRHEPRAFAQEAKDWEPFAAVARQLSNSQQTAWTDVTEEYWDHYRRDPRGRVMLAVHDSAGNPVGTGMLTTVESISSQGMQKVPMLDSVAVTGHAADALAALFSFAATRSEPGSTIIASNLSFLDAGVFRAAGARLLPSTFNTHGFVRGHHPVFGCADSLNLEVT